MQDVTKKQRSFGHSTLGVSSLAAFVVALKISLRKFVAVGAAWMVGLFAGASLTTAQTPQGPIPGTPEWYCEDSLHQEACVNAMNTCIQSDRHFGVQVDG